MNIGLDIGYDRTKIYAAPDRLAHFPSVTGTPETSSFSYSGNEHDIILDHPYSMAVGDYAIEQSAAIDARIDRNWLESNKWHGLALAALSEVTRASATMHIVAGLPISYYHDRDMVRDKLTGIQPLQRRGRNWQTLTVERCTVMPQGFGVLFAECLNDSGRVVDQTLRSGRVGIIDIGGKTTNLLVANQLRQVDKESTSLDTGGWSVVARVQSYLNSECPDLGLNEYELVSHVISRKVWYKKQEIDLTDVVNEAVDVLASEIIGGARRWWNGAARLNAILIAGGGAGLVGQALLKEYPGQARLVGGDPVFSNAIGYWRFAQAQR